MTSFSEQLRLIKATKMVHRAWYMERYPDVAEAGMEPATHYLRFGADLGRDPGKHFDTEFYRATYPEARKSGLNPLVHYATVGKDKGYLTRPSGHDARKRVNIIRTKLLSLGFTERPLAELTVIADTDHDPEARALANRELALWHIRAKTEAGYREALDRIERAWPDAPDLAFRAKLATVELLCRFHLGEIEAGEDAYESAAIGGQATPDMMLARANLESRPDRRVVWINQVLARYGIEPVTLRPDEGQPFYDRLTCAVDLPRIAFGPKVTVLIAAYDAADMLPTTLRSLQEQTWQNLEIIVLDDCSPTSDTVAIAKSYAATDARIKVVRLAENGGAYVARNHGLDIATGEFVTIHDADDWSHPKKIETQVQYLMDHSQAIGCMSEQARMRDNLSVTRLTGSGHFIIKNVSSLLWRRGPVREELGYWDTVRFAADSELIRRMEHVWGRSAVVTLKGGPLSFQRDGDTSVIADEVMGMNGFYFGARKEYYDAQRFYHKSGQSLKYESNKDRRPFPIPIIMEPDRKRLVAENSHIDKVLAGDFRLPGPQIDKALEVIGESARAGKTVGLVESYDYDLDAQSRKSIDDRLRQEVDGKAVQVLVFGETRRYSPPIIGELYEKLRYIPKLMKVKQ